MSKYTAEQVRNWHLNESVEYDELGQADSSYKHAEMADAIDTLLRERESAKAAVTDETRGTYACPICGKEYPHYHPEDTSRVNWHSDYRKVFEDIISANVRLYKDGVSIAPTNYSHESKLTVAGIAGHWFAYGAEDARSFGRESKGTDSAAWSEFASNGDGYAYAWMDSLWSLFKQTVVALKGREAVAPMLASAWVPDGHCSGVRTCAHCGKPKMNCDCHDTSGFRMLPPAAGVSRMWDNEKAVLVSFERKPTDDELRALHDMLAEAPKPESPAKGFERICERGTAKTKPEAEE